ncbi:hypothetical protein F4813DRAFT_159965 [Daldinia decipiens]|uniref:uncharacterized protein n=1 Tax=Daldinia decipiens TaxID=326647 RepID=UPI0020C46763|nr:uncharacterized protein F4813DRAFT_159965 [Daldinia decipiens]KAI1655461.1 hypothetical protein F4813DRAFT_159965 [Daldinia decipiens]
MPHCLIIPIAHTDYLLYSSHTTIEPKKKNKIFDIMVRGLVSLSTLILAAVSSAAPLTPSAGTEAKSEVRTANDKTEAVPDVFFYNWGKKTKREAGVPDLVFVGWGAAAKREDHREEQS